MIKNGETGLADKSGMISAGIIDSHLCTRCGTCSAICPQDAIWRDDDYFPHLDPDKCTECGLCARVCPGQNISALALQKNVFGIEQWPGDYTGHYQQAYAAHSTHQAVRRGGASGGVVTELLLYLLESGEIDGAIVTTIDKDNPRRAKSIIARTREELLEAQQSKYIVYPVNDILKTIRQNNGRFAYVGLPCQIQGLRKWLQMNKRMRDRILYIIGLFCLTTFETPIIDELYAIKGNRRKKLKDFRFREGKWPGNICAIYKDGHYQKLHYSNFKDGAINYLTQLYTPYRCQMCTDGTAEFADLSVADAWMRNAEKDYLYPAMSTVLLRTETGSNLFKRAVEHKRLEAYALRREDVYNTYLTLETNKKINARLRAMRRQRKHKSIPVYDEPMLHVSLSNRWHELKSTLYQSLGRQKTARRFMIRILLSKFMLPLVKIRATKKKKQAHVVD